MYTLAPYAKALAFALLVILALHLRETYEVQTVADEAVLMEPAVRHRSTRIFRTDGAMPPRGAVVWFEHPALQGKMLLARAIGVPGDRIGIRGGRAMRDGRPLAEDYAEKRLELEDLAEVAVPAGHLFLLNDARAEAGSPRLDSRLLGVVPVTAVQGYLSDRVSEREAGEEAKRAR